ncbi:MAG: 50S ribosome-binding GTPase [Anaerolineaceae bacterium]|nr:50S ribosome-binding GTPase [Anaerolineaceae bacterium]
MNQNQHESAAILPGEKSEKLQAVWGSLNPAEKKALESLLKGIPSDMNLMRMLLRLSAQHVRMAFGKKHHVAIVGPTNVGKSTLYNQLILRKSDRAEVSPLPGTTRITKEAESDLFNIVDTPGADAIGETGKNQQEMAMQAAVEADFLVVVFDAIQGVKTTELELFQELSFLQKPMVVVINKIDLVKKHRASILQQAAASLNIKPEQVVPISAKTAENLPQLLIAIASNEPELVAALGQSLPQYRWQLAWRSIVSAASISAVIALTPLPIVDFAPLIITQSIMILGIARIYDYKITLGRAKELALTFGLGFLGRTLFYELSKLGGLPGWLLSAAIASSTTVVMGYAASSWFEKGEKISQQTLKQLTTSTTEYLLARLKGKKRPDKKQLQKDIADMLEESSLGETRSFFEEQQSSEQNIQYK